MNINPIQNNNQNTTSFKMNLKFENRATRELFKKGLKDLYETCVPKARAEYFGDNPFNAEKMILALQKRFRQMTKEVGGTVRITEDTTPKPSYFTSDSFKLHFTDNRGKKYIHPGTIGVNDFKPFPTIDQGKPYSSAVKMVLAQISDAIALAGNGDGKNNIVHTLLQKIYSEEKPFASRISLEELRKFMDNRPNQNLIKTFDKLPLKGALSEEFIINPLKSNPKREIIYLNPDFKELKKISRDLKINPKDFSTKKIDG